MKKFLVLFFSFTVISFSSEILTLQDAIKIGIENNLKTKIYKDRVEQTYYQKNVAGSYFLPRVSTSFNFTHLGDNQPITFGPFPPVTLTDDDLYTLKFTVSQPLFTGGKIIKGYELSKEAYQKAKIDYEAELQNLILDVKKAYFGVLKAEKMVGVSRKYKELTEKHLKDVKEMFEEGLATKLDILKMELAVKQAQTGIIESENYLSLAKAHLNFLLNRPADFSFEIQDTTKLFNIENRDYNWWKEMALRERKEIQSMERVISIYRKNTEIEKANFFPQVYLFFNYQTEKGTQSARDDWEDNWNTGIMVSYDIWNWGETRNKVRKAIKEREEMEKQFELLKSSIELEVKNAYLNITSAEKKVRQVEKQLEVAEENMRVAEILYKEGMATTTELVDAITSLTEARSSYYTALYEWEVAYSELEKSAGKQGD